MFEFDEALRQKRDLIHVEPWEGSDTMSSHKNHNEPTSVGRMIDHHLRRRALVTPPVSSGNHLDEDALASFVEGRLTQPQSAPLISHLVACAFCRRATTELIQLDTALGEFDSAPSMPTPEPGRLRHLLSYLSDLAARAKETLSISDEGAVSAYEHTHTPAEDFAEAEKASRSAKRKRAAEKRAPQSDAPSDPSEDVTGD